MELGYNRAVSHAFVHLSPTLAELAAKHAVITPNERLAREFKLAFDQYQVQQGRRAWEGLTCMSLQRFFLQLLSEHVDQMSASAPKLLSAHALREAAFLSAPQTSLNQVDAFCSAWQMIHRYDINLQDSAFSTRQGEQFRAWFDAVERALPEAELLPETLGDYLRVHDVLPQYPIVLLDFEQLTLVERRYFDYLADRMTVLVCGDNAACVKPWSATALEQHQATNEVACTLPQVAAYENLNDELAAAASWARAVKADCTSATIGIVVPALAQNYARVQRQIAAILDPQNGSLTDMFDLSAGVALSEQQLWRHADMLLRACRDGFDPQVCAELGNSKFFDLSALHELSQNWPRHWHQSVSLVEIMQRILPDQAFHLEVTGVRTFNQWLVQCRILLAAFGWPQLQTLGSTAFQIYQSLEESFNQFSQDSLAQPLTFTQMLRLLGASLASQISAPERPHADILVLGELETTGLNFSHLWVCGLDENSFPGKNIAHPFIPRRIAQAAGVPRASQAAELAFARRRLAHWRTHADELVFSYSAQSQQHDQLPSPLIAGFPVMQAAPAVTHEAITEMPPETDCLETYVDERGPVMAQDQVKGGTGLLQAQATCPFKAFAQYRLGLAQPDVVSSFPDPLTRGNLLHDTLFDLVRRHSTQAALAALLPADIRRACRKTLEAHPRRLPALFIEQEIERLCTLILNWMKIEAARAPFAAVYLEETFVLKLQSYQFSIRVDRVDRVEGGLVVIDYKTGQVSLSGITTSPTRDPQLPAYSLIDSDIVGVYFAEIREQTRLLGVADEAGRIEGAQYARASQQADTWQAHRQRWQHDLTQLADDFASGQAVVDPLPGACRYCHLADFCRVEDQVEY
ncbi:MAG: PD-(D/E)XK nuclease family protein [bacterium]